jgi:N-acyl homoserine lactone hydrolase
MSSYGLGTKFTIGEYEIDIIVHGFLSKPVCHGSLGFSTIALIRRGTRLAILDVGSFGQRNFLQQ